MSSSEEFVTWEPGPNRRGTLNILVACLTTLSICVWSSLHLNIPKERPTLRQNLTRKLLWVSVGVLVPEMLILFACTQFLSAREIRDRVNKKAGFTDNQASRRSTHDPEDDTSKGDFLLSDFQQAMEQDSESAQGISLGENQDSLLQNEAAMLQQPEMGQGTTPAKRVHRWTLVHGFYATMGGFVYQSCDDYGNVTREVVSPYGFIQLLEERPNLVPDIPEEVICDKGKSDGLAKTLLIAQVSWFCINCIGRLAQDLPLTLLEISTVAHAACSLFVYALWWHKPLNVSDTMDVTYEGIQLDVRSKGLFDTEARNHTEDIGEKGSLIFGAICIVVGAIYGAPHFLAWNSSFATHTEQLLWRICTCAVVGAPIVCGVFIVISNCNGVSKLAQDLNMIGGVVSILVYFPANLYIIAASLRQLFYLPPASFMLPVWSNYFPHFS